MKYKVKVNNSELKTFGTNNSYNCYSSSLTLHVPQSATIKLWTSSNGIKENILT